MSHKELDGGLVALMELHCREYRIQYGHLRVDGMDQLEPIPFPSRQMPTFFQLQAVSDKNLKLWIQIERTLFDHYEVPMHFRGYMDVQPRQMGKATRAWMLGTLLDIAIPFPATPKRTNDDLGVPIRSDLTVDWDSILYSRKPLRGAERTQVGIGGHFDKEERIPFVVRPMNDVHLIGGIGRGRFSDFLAPIHRMWDRIHQVMDDDYRKPKHSTDYPKRKGWLQIPDQKPNEAKPSPVLLALIKRSA